MEDDKGNIEELSKDLSRYIETRIEHAKLKSISIGIEISAQTLGAVLLTLTFLLFYFCLMCGLAIYLGSKLGGTHVGFMVLSAIHLFIFAVILLLKNSLIIYPFRERMVKILLKNSK
jgi:hypothetical protein